MKRNIEKKGKRNKNERIFFFLENQERKTYMQVQGKKERKVKRRKIKGEIRFV
jgi:hypothetical protein